MGIEMLATINEEKAIENIEKGVDGRSTIVQSKPPLVRLETRGIPFGAKILPKNSTKRDAPLFEHRKGRPGNGGEKNVE